MKTAKVLAVCLALTIFVSACHRHHHGHHGFHHKIHNHHLVVVRN